MSKDKKISLLDILEESKNFDLALMTTFNFEIEYFERAILKCLYKNNVRKISLFVDSGQLNKALQETRESTIGYKYMVNSVNIASSFHSKVILLLGERNARLIVSSANIKTSGYAINNEVFNYIDYSFEHPEYLDVINSAMNYFLKINELTYKLDDKLLQQLKEYVYYRETKQNGSVYFIDNIKKSMVSQVNAIVNEHVKKIIIAVPYYDNGLETLAYIKQIYHDAEIVIYVQNEKNTFPVKVNNKKQIVKKINVFKGFKNKEIGANNFYHGKVFLFQTDKKDYVLYGSANCTKAAFTLSYFEGGNIESDFLVEGCPGEFNYFFEEMEILSDQELISNVMTFEKKEQCCFSFRYGDIQEKIEFHFGYKNSTGPFHIYYQGESLSFVCKKDEVIVFLELEKIEQCSGIFDILFVTNNGTEIVKCWLVNRIALFDNRVKLSDNNYLESFEVDSDGDKYIKDRTQLLMKEVTCLSDLKEHQIKMNTVPNSTRDLDDVDISDEEFVVDIEIPDEYRIYQKQYKVINNIRNIYFNKFLSKYPSIFEKVNSVEISEHHDLKETKNIEKKTKKRKPTSDEEAFVRFVKRQVSGMLDRKFIDQIDLLHAIALMTMILDIFEKYTDQKEVENLFDRIYMLETRKRFLSLILDKYEVDKDEKRTGESLLRYSLDFMMQVFCLRGNETDVILRNKYDEYFREILLKVDEKYYIRENYQEYLKWYSLKGYDVLKGEGYKAICEYIEKRFGFKPFKLLKNYIEAIYPNAQMEIKDGKFIVSLSVNDLSKYRRPNPNILREIKNYADTKKGIHWVEIDVSLKSNGLQNKNQIKSIKNYVNLENHLWTEVDKRFNGKTTEEKAVHISF